MLPTNVKISFVLLFLATIECVQSYKILAIMGHQGKSHFFVFEPLFKALAAKGHQVTVLGHFPQKTKIPNYTDVDISGPSDREFQANFFDINEIPKARYTMHLSMVMLALLSQHTCDVSVNESESLKAFLKVKRTYDVILMEVFNSDCFLGIVQRYPAPVIGLSAGPIMPWADPRFGNPATTSHVPVMFMDFTTKMNFWQRLENTLTLAFNRIMYYLIIARPNQLSAEKYFHENIDKNMNVNLQQVAYNMSLLFLSTHHSVHGARPLVPSIIEVGGIHVGTPKPLPLDIQKWIDESKDGVILLSFGSMIKGHTFPEEQRIAFQKVFKRLPQRIIWKWENETMIDKPDNVKLVSWLPQYDILCHRNVKAFISHGGLLGTTEAVHCGVPAVVFPQYGDQHTNAKALEASGGGIVLKFSTATEEIIYDALTKVLDPSFYKRTKELSEMFRDRPLPPLDTAVYWTEYVARHKGAPRMRSVTVDMPFYQYLLLDVFAFLFAVLAIYLFIAWKCCSFIYKKLCSKKPQEKKKKKQ